MTKVDMIAARPFPRMDANGQGVRRAVIGEPVEAADAKEAAALEAAGKATRVTAPKVEKTEK